MAVILCPILALYPKMPPVFCLEFSGNPSPMPKFLPLRSIFLGGSRASAARQPLTRLPQTRTWRAWLRLPGQTRPVLGITALWAGLPQAGGPCGLPKDMPSSYSRAVDPTPGRLCLGKDASRPSSLAFGATPAHSSHASGGEVVRGPSLLSTHNFPGPHWWWFTDEIVWEGVVLTNLQSPLAGYPSGSQDLSEASEQIQFTIPMHHYHPWARPVQARVAWGYCCCLLKDSIHTYKLLSIQNRHIWAHPCHRHPNQETKRYQHQKLLLCPFPVTAPHRGLPLFLTSFTIT